MQGKFILGLRDLGIISYLGVSWLNKINYSKRLAQSIFLKLKYVTVLISEKVHKFDLVQNKL